MSTVLTKVFNKRWC